MFLGEKLSALQGMNVSSNVGLCSPIILHHKAQTSQYSNFYLTQLGTRGLQMILKGFYNQIQKMVPTQRHMSNGLN